MELAAKQADWGILMPLCGISPFGDYPSVFAYGESTSL